MSRVVCAWEMGGGTGHLRRLGALAGALARRGHDVALAAKALEGIAALGEARGLEVFQAPMWTRRVPEAPPVPETHAGILAHFGYLDPAGLAGLVRGWRAILGGGARRCDLLIADHAPTALLAARASGVPAVLFGTGFACPPAASPLPALRPWQPVPAARRAALEGRVLAAANQVLSDLGAPPLGTLAELFSGRARPLATFPELDPFPERDRPDHRGAYHSGTGSPGAGGVRRTVDLLVYLDTRSPGTAALLEAIARGGWRARAYLAGPAARAAGGGRIELSPRPLDPAREGAGARLVVCHGGLGTVAASLLAGTPLLVAPRHLEQALTARSLVAMGAGAEVPGDAPVELARSRIAQALEAPGPRAAAGAFADRHRGYSPRAMIDSVAETCEEALAGASGPD